MYILVSWYLHLSTAIVVYNPSYACCVDVLYFTQVRKSNALVVLIILFYSYLF